MKLPERINSESELDDLLADPSPADVESVASLSGDVLILGAGGKIGPSLARRVHRAVTRAGSATRVIAASRFSSPDVRAGLDAEGIGTIACDLLDERQIAALPRCASILLLAGRKFGTLDRTELTWATNTIVPARVAAHFSQSRMVVFSTGNVYPMVPAEGPAPAETILVITPGSGLNRIGAALAQAGVVESELLFRAGIMRRGRTAQLKAGEYAFPAHASEAQVMDMLVTRKILEHRITIANDGRWDDAYEALPYRFVCGAEL